MVAILLEHFPNNYFPEFEFPLCGRPRDFMFGLFFLAYFFYFFFFLVLSPLVSCCDWGLGTGDFCIFRWGPGGVSTKCFIHRYTSERHRFVVSSEF